MKATKVKAWPELVDYLPSLPAFRETRTSGLQRLPPLEIDFGSVRQVSSTGLASFILRLLRLLRTRRTAQIRHDGSPMIRAELERLGAFKLLGGMAGAFQGDLPFRESETEKNMVENIRISLPIYRIKFDDYEDRRRPIHEFITWLSQELQGLCATHQMQPNGLVMLLNEIAKNSADHAQSDALFGIDATTVDQNQTRLTFVFGDLGIDRRFLGIEINPRFAKAAVQSLGPSTNWLRAVERNENDTSSSVAFKRA
jgi:hypothetical protein